MVYFPGTHAVVRYMFNECKFVEEEGFHIESDNEYKNIVEKFNQVYTDLLRINEEEKTDKDKARIILDYWDFLQNPGFTYGHSRPTSEVALLNAVALLNNEDPIPSDKSDDNNEIKNLYKNKIKVNQEWNKSFENLNNYADGLKKAGSELAECLNKIIGKAEDEYGLIVTRNGNKKIDKVQFDPHIQKQGSMQTEYIWVQLKTPGDMSNFSISLFLNNDLAESIKNDETKGALYLCVELKDDSSNDEEKKKLERLDEIFINDDRVLIVQLDNRKRYSIPIFYRKNNGEDVLFNDTESLEDYVCNKIKILMEGYKEVQTLDPIAEIIEKQISAGHKQIILTGAPGTGKTYSALAYASQNKDITKDVYNFTQFHPSYDYTDFVEGIRPVQHEVGDKSEMTFVKMDGTFKSFCRFVVEKTFEGLKIGELDDLELEDKINLLYILEDNDYDPKEGLKSENIKAIIKERFNNKNLENMNDEIMTFFNNYKDKLCNNYCFVIDEINRADIPKVFGELMFALEYRGIKNRKPTQYQNLETYHKDKGKDCFREGFFIPENVIIIGTMNDIDKSVESFDFAMRRRFRWPEVNVNQEFLKLTLTSILSKKNGPDFDSEKYKDQIEKLSKNISDMNEVIRREEFMGSSAYDIGPAYFNDYELNVKDEKSINTDSLEDIYDNRIRPILVEYTRGRGNAEKYTGLYEECHDKLVIKMTNS